MTGLWRVGKDGVGASTSQVSPVTTWLGILPENSKEKRPSKGLKVEGAASLWRKAGCVCISVETGPVCLLPEPLDRVSCRNISPGTLSLGWAPQGGWEREWSQTTCWQRFPSAGIFRWPAYSDCLQCGRHRPDPSPLPPQQWRTPPRSLTQPPPLSCLRDCWLAQTFDTLGTHCCLGAFVQAWPPVQIELWAESKVGLLGD